MPPLNEWLHEPFDAATRAEVARLMRDDPQALHDAFYKTLSFGTGGMRGLMGVGTNRMNIYTVRAASYGLARYVQKQGGKRAFVGYDTRHHSAEFALETARVLAGAGLQVFLTSAPCPTPLASFGCRHFQCQTAVMITASHNPPQYNGYKVYGQDGAQVVAPADEGILQEVRKVKLSDPIPLAPSDSPLIVRVGSELDPLFLNALRPYRALPHLKGSLRVVYSSLHGTGIRLMPSTLADWEIGPVSVVQAQAKEDGAFPTCPSPNPEEEAALAMGMAQLLQEEGDLFLATDPDADRIGAVVRHKGKGVRFNGHQIGVLLLDHLLRNGKKGTVIKSIVTTELFRKIAQEASCPCLDVLTGFKYIAEQIDTVPFLLGAEESYGYLIGPYVRDKDAMGAGALLAEAALQAKQEGMTLVDRLEALYKRFGMHREMLISLRYPDSAEGMAAQKAVMEKLRKHPPEEIGGVRVVQREDYLAGTLKGFPPSNVLRYFLKDGTKIVVRPSGTEPQLKLYLEAVGESEQRLLELSQYLRALCL